MKPIEEISFVSGAGLIVGSLILMFTVHEFMYSDIGFIIGVVLIGLACARNKKINTDQMNKNIQTMNDALWGKPEKKEDKKITNITLYRMTLHEREKKP